MMKKTNLITAILFSLLLFGFAIAFLILPDKAFSEQENRGLRTLPKFSLEKLASGEYADEINDYFADQFPLRDALVGLKGISELTLGKGENNGILLGENGQLADRLFDAKREDGTTVPDTDGFDAAHVAGAAEGLNRVTEGLDIPFTALITPRTLDVAESAFDYPFANTEALWQSFYGALDEDVDALDTLPMLREKYENGESVYYKTDHHWTTLGAYYAYAELMRAWGMERDMLPISYFTREVASDAFYGTAWSAGGMKLVAPDSLEIWHAPNEDDFLVIADGKELDGFYSIDYLAKKDKYSVFLDGTHDVVTVTKKNGEARPTLLLLKDSFANSLAPFLAQHFDLVLLNLSSVRSDYTDVSASAQKYAADRVLLVYTMENVVTANKLNRFR